MTEAIPKEATSAIYSIKTTGKTHTFHMVHHPARVASNVHFSDGTVLFSEKDERCTAFAIIAAGNKLECVIMAVDLDGFHRQHPLIPRRSAVAVFANSKKDPVRVIPRPV